MTPRWPSLALLAACAASPIADAPLPGADAPLSLDARAPKASYVGTTLTDSAGYRWRDGVKLWRFGGRWLLLGGWSNDFTRIEWSFEDTTNEILESPDLVHWSTLLPHAKLDGYTDQTAMRWTRRHAFSVFEWAGRLCVSGRDHVYSSPIVDLWCSPDAVSWTPIARRLDPLISERRMPAMVPFGGLLHLFGGEPDTTMTACAEHWSSPDGITWTREADMPFARSSFGLTELGGKLFFLGGNAGGTHNGGPDRILKNDVWSWDGHHWQHLTDAAPFAPIMWVDAVTYDGEVWVLGGRTRGADGRDHDIPAAWHSSDGRHWAFAAAPWPATHADGVFVTADGISLAGGNQVAASTFRLAEVGP